MATQPRKYTFQHAVGEAGGLVGLMVLIKVMELVLGISLAVLGILPRTAEGIVGVLTAPLLHGNLAHLFANVGPLFVLLVLLFWDRTYHPARTLGVVWLASGLGTWLIGRATGPDGEPTVHIGASSLIYGLVAFLIVSGVLARKSRTFLVAILVFVVFGGIFYGVLPQEATSMSWEGHLTGAIAGLIAGVNRFRNRSRRKSARS